MKKTILAMMALTAATTSAFASETERTRLYRFDFDCGFNNEVTCTANAHIVAPGDRHRDRDRDMNDMNRKNLLSVSCGGTLIYAGPAALESDRHVVKIAPPGGHTPAIIIPRHDREFSAEWMSYRSFLRVRHEKIPGECRVRAVPLHHDDEIVINSDDVSELQ